MINHKTNRFYWLSIAQDLFGSWCLHKVYGGTQNKHIKEVWIPFKSQLEASQQMFDVEVLRLRHGYSYADIEIAESYVLTPEIIECNI